MAAFNVSTTFRLPMPKRIEALISLCIPPMPVQFFNQLVDNFLSLSAEDRSWFKDGEAPPHRECFPLDLSLFPWLSDFFPNVEVPENVVSTIPSSPPSMNGNISDGLSGNVSSSSQTGSIRPVPVSKTPELIPSDASLISMLRAIINSGKLSSGPEPSKASKNVQSDNGSARAHDGSKSTVSSSISS